MASITSFVRKEIPHLTPVVFLCLMFVLANASGPMILMLERMQTKSKKDGLDYFDFAIFLVFMFGLVGSTILAFRSRASTDYKVEMEKRKEAYETSIAAKEDEFPKVDPEGHLK